MLIHVRVEEEKRHTADIHRNRCVKTKTVLYKCGFGLSKSDIRSGGIVNGPYSHPYATEQIDIKE